MISDVFTTIVPQDTAVCDQIGQFREFCTRVGRALQQNDT